MDENHFPDGIPHEWFRIVKRVQFKSSDNQYENPHLIKKTVKKYVSDGVLHFVTSLIDGTNGEKLGEYIHGVKPPSKEVVLALKKEDFKAMVTKKSMTPWEKQRALKQHESENFMK